MKIIVIGASGTIGSEVAKALERNRHEVIRASRSADVKVSLEDAASLRAMFREVGNVDAVISCAGEATTNADGQVEGLPLTRCRL
jgi:nucleoside-diphosphate-sugar epimerase